MFSLRSEFGLNAWVLTPLLFLLISPLSAQPLHDTLKEVSITSDHKVLISRDDKVNSFSPGQKKLTIDSAVLQQYQLQNVASLLAQQSPAFIRSYGFNSLATLNFRGASSAQSQVLWNGVPIQNASLGLADISLLPVFLIDKVNLVYGSSAALWGSGNVGGALLIENDAPAFNKGKSLSIFGGGGSFGQYLGGFKGTVSGKNYYWSIRGVGQSAVNDFPYKDDYGNPKKVDNSRLVSGGLLLESAYRISQSQKVGFSAWYQKYDREIPAATFEPYSVKNQKDESLRLILDWDKHKEYSDWYVKTSFTKDVVQYNNAAILLTTDNTTYQYFQEAGWKKGIDKHYKLLVFIPVQLNWITIKNDVKQQSKVALAAALSASYLKDQLQMAINARGEQINNTSVLLPGANIAYKPVKWFALRVNGQRTYRAPTLNELYYFPGGNTQLKPEQGWNIDAGYTMKINKRETVSFVHDLSIFNREIKDWIIWLGGSVWTPHNIATVRSRGIETENNIVFNYRKWLFHIGLNTSYIIATTQSSYIPNDESIGRQIPYTPVYNGQLNVGFTVRKLSVNYNHAYTGFRYITQDESESQPAYWVGNMQLIYQPETGKRSLQVIAQCNNIWNQTYQVVGFRPMPGVNYLAGVKVTIK